MRGARASSWTAAYDIEMDKATKSSRANGVAAAEAKHGNGFARALSEVSWQER
jgi:hypothetical protein